MENQEQFYNRPGLGNSFINRPGLRNVLLVIVICLLYILGKYFQRQHFTTASTASKVNTTISK